MRSVKTILSDFPGLSKDLPPGSKRERAFIESLETATKSDYELLKFMLNCKEVVLFIPEKRVAGSLLNATNKQAVLYLNPMLEEMKYSTVLRVTKHELSHLLRDSDFYSGEPLSMTEAKATLKAELWGES